MDASTRRLRARNKALANKRGELPEFAPRGLGRKLKPAETFPLKQCSHIEGGKKTLIFKRRKADQSLYAIPLHLGGTRCPATAITSRGYCLDHVADRPDE